MRKLITGFVIALALTATLCACSQEPEIVNITTLRSSPEKFVGKRVKFYLDRVQDSTGTGADSTDPAGYLMSFDNRMGYDFNISIMLMPKLLDKWTAANLDDRHEYTVTVTGDFSSTKLDKLTFYQLNVDDFVINSENEFSKVFYTGSKTADGLPAQTIVLPRPARVLDVNQIGLFPDQFKSKLLLIEAIVSKDNFKSGAGDTVQLRTSALTFVLSKKLTENIYDKVAPLAYMEIVGTLEVEKAADGSPMITVEHMRFVQ